MATGRKPNQTRRPAYRPPGAVDGNLARKLDYRELERRLDNSGQMDFDQLYHRQRMSDAERRAKQRAKLRASVRPAQHISPVIIAGALCVAGLMIALLMCYVKINAISRSIVSMKNQITRLEVEQVSLLTRHEQAFDMSTVKEAAEAAGMTQPSDSQVFYVRLPGEDQATVHKSSGGLSGFFAAFQRGFYAAAEYFR
ncbi:MAG: hypothetical protein K2N78_12225 [Oscillospiraceae bacterium]|nr:hypothetical protein [Oscillospiraceae bacterium]